MQKSTRRLLGATALVVVAGAAFAVYQYSGQRAGVVITGPGGVLGAPEAGRWVFRMTASAERLAGAGCPSGQYAQQTAGGAVLRTANDGQIIRLDLDGQSLTFFRVAGPNGVYRTDQRSFPVQRPDGTTSQGTVTFELRTSSRTEATGTVHWDNVMGCTAQYPFSLTWERPLDTPTSRRPRQGRWTLSLGTPEGNCQPPFTHFDGMPTQLTLTERMTAAGTPGGDIRIDGLRDASGILDHTVVYRVGDGPEWTSSLEEFDLGAPMSGVNAMFDYVDVDFTGALDLTALNDIHLDGRLIVRASTGCLAFVPVALDFIGG